MSLPLQFNGDFQSFPMTIKCATKTRCQAAAGGLEGDYHSNSCFASSGGCSQLPSLTSEEDSSFLTHDSDSLKCDEEPYFAAAGSPMALLHCDDALEDDDDEDTTREWAPGRPSTISSGVAYHHSDAQETLCNELSKEVELGAFTPTPVPPEYRGILVQWMREVCAVRALAPATFFTSVSLLDRFLRAAGEASTPPSLLQLVALTCISVATKSEQQQCAVELLSLARDENGNLYKSEDSRRMELHLLDLLDWRLRMPTVYTFTSLFTHRVLNRPEDGLVVPPGAESRFWELVLHLAELAVSDHDLTAVSFSILAVACLLIAETEVKGGQMTANLKTLDSLRTVPGLQLTGPALSGPVQRLYALYKAAVAASSFEPSSSPQ